MFTHCPEKLVPGKYNIVATQRDQHAILWKDGQYFIISVLHPDYAKPISETGAFSIDAHGRYVHPDPIPLDDILEWRAKAAEVKIPLLPIGEQTFGRR